jgi:hypothetical protein
LGGCLVWTTSALAQPFTLEFFSFDGGGGLSAGGGFSLAGTIGQPDAGSLRGGAFTLEGGFWPGATSVTIPGGPTLVIEGLGDQVRISWSPATPGFVLETTTRLGAADWQPAPLGNPLTAPGVGTLRYYRLRKP